MAATPRQEGVLICGFDPISVDTVATQIMGFEPSLIRDIKRGSKLRVFQLTDDNNPIRIDSNVPDWQTNIKTSSNLGFSPHYAWRSYLKGEV